MILRVIQRKNWYEFVSQKKVMDDFQKKHFYHNFFLFLVMEPQLCNRLCPSRRSVQFLVADMQLHKRLCPSVNPSVRPSNRVNKSKSRKMSVLEACVCVCVGRKVGWGVRCRWGLAAPAHPSATTLWPRVTCSFIHSKIADSRASIFFEDVHTWLIDIFKGNQKVFFKN